MPPQLTRVGTRWTNRAFSAAHDAHDREAADVLVRERSRATSRRASRPRTLRRANLVMEVRANRMPRRGLAATFTTLPRA